MLSNFLYFWIVSVAIALAGFLFLRFSKNAQSKRVVFPLMLILTDAILIYFAWTNFGDEFGRIVYIFAGLAVAMTYLNYRRVAFCDACAAMTSSDKLLVRPTECSSCGSKWV